MTNQKVMLPMSCAHHQHVGYGSSKDHPCPWCEVERLRDENAALIHDLERSMANHVADINAPEPPADPNPLDPANHYFRLCPNGHAPYSISFDGCPSCKAVAMNSAQQLNRT
jgi:hypothetical protein